MDFEHCGVSEKYKEYAKYGDSLHEMGEKMDWESLRPIFQDLYINDTVKGGRPNCTVFLTSGQIKKRIKIRFLPFVE